MPQAQPTENEKLALEALLALRGRRAQAQLSQQLGYSYNQVYLWESGRRGLHWADFVAVCEVLRRPLVPAFTKYFSVAASPEPVAIAELMRNALKPYRKGEISRRLGVTPSKLSRWLGAKSDPPLAMAFAILRIGHLNFAEFLDEVVGAGKLASLQSEVERHRRLREALASLPFVGALAPALGLRGFRRITRYWAERAPRALDHEKLRSFFGHRVFGVTTAGYAKLRQAQLDYYHAISAILAAETGPADQVVVVNFQTFLPEEAVTPA
jgi:transcriptional regulator with XRE-family HTH domain